MISISGDILGIESELEPVGSGPGLGLKFLNYPGPGSGTKIVDRSVPDPGPGTQKLIGRVRVRAQKFLDPTASNQNRRQDRNHGPLFGLFLKLPNSSRQSK